MNRGYFLELLRALAEIRTPFLNWLFHALTYLGDEQVIILVMCLCFWCISKEVVYKTGIAFFISGLAVQGAKIMFRVERPWVYDSSFSPVGYSTETATGYSFPSGHTQAGTALWGTLGVIVKSLPFKIFCFSAVLIVAFTRLYLGVHFLADVLFSLGFTFAVIFLVTWFWKGELSKKREKIIVAIMLGFSALTIVYAFNRHNAGIIEASYLRDALIAAGACAGFGVGMYMERNFINFSVKTTKLYWQIPKFIGGLLGVAAIMALYPVIIGRGLALDTIRYFLLLLWVTVFYPIIIKYGMKKIIQ